jgi:plastocyanin
MLRAAALLIPLLAAGAAASAAQVQSVSLTLKDHRFQPATITASAGQPIEIVLTDKDATPEEFDSDDLGGVEEIVHPGQTIRFRVGPLKPGRYEFIGEGHAKTAQGVIIVR